MPWYRVRLSIDDITLGKHLRLQNMFETLFLNRSEPPGAAMFVNGDPKDDYTYFFSPPCAVFLTVVLGWFGASACAPPVQTSVVWLAGDLDARGAVQRS
jgi:hypothetical protein